MSQKVKFGISLKLLLTMLVIALLPLLVIWYFSYSAITHLTTEKVNQELTAINETLTGQVNDWVDLNQRMMLQNSELSSVRSMRADLQNPVLVSITKNYDWAYLSFTVDLDGNNIGRSDGKKVKYYGDRDYFKQVVNGRQFGRQILIGKTSGKPAMVLSTGIHDSKGRLKGVLAQAMTLTELSKKIIDYKIGQSGFAFLIDEKDDVVAHPDGEITRSRVNLSQDRLVQAVKNGQGPQIVELDGGQKVIAVGQKTEQGWLLISQQNYDEAYRLIRQENQKALSLLIFTILLVCGIAMFVSKTLTAPIRQLTDVADKYSQGQLDLKISGLSRNDEIGQLSQAIDRLGTSMKMALTRLKKQK